MRLKTQRHKYNAKGCVIDGIRFPSLKEGRRYSELKLLSAAGEIDALELQPSFRLEVNGKLICVYRADFLYRTRGAERITVEDVKGFLTKEYRIKAKLFRVLFPQYEHIET